MTHGSLIERITRSLAYMLRHQPEEFDLELDRFGYAEIDEVVCALNERLGEPIEDDDVEEAIGAGDRPRYEIKDGKIRALYGHSVAIDPGESSEPPEQLFVGLGSRDADRVHRQGLRGGRRTFLHLALTFEDAREAGRRAAEEYAVVTVQAREAWEEGIDFFDRQSLFLSESVPTEFLEVSETYTDGQRREHRERGGRGGRGRRDDRPRRSERSGRDERPSRDERSSRDERPRRDERSSRDERPRRDERPARAPREERRDEVAPQPPPIKPAPAARKPARKTEPSRGGFGTGIFESSGTSAPKSEPVVERKPAPKPAPREKPAEPAPPEGGGFGAGL